MEHRVERTAVKSPVRAAVAGGPDTGRPVTGIPARVLERASRIVLLSVVLCVLALAECSPNQPSSQSSFASRPDDSAQQAPLAAEAGLAEGEASGTFTAKGETVALKYAYAGRSTRFGKDSIIVLLTDKPVPNDALGDELKSQTKLYAGEIRGVEYAIDKDGFWVMYHPAGYQESSPRPMKEFSVDNGAVKGVDEGSDLSGGKYQRSVSFTAHLQGERK